MKVTFNEEYCLDYNPFEGDFGDPGDTVLSDKIVTANGGSKCSECLSTTEKGERNRVMNAVFGGSLSSYRWCSACCHAFSLAFDGNDNFEEALADRGVVRSINENSTRESK